MNHETEPMKTMPTIITLKLPPETLTPEDRQALRDVAADLMRRTRQPEAPEV